MKSRFALVLLLLVALTFSGCLPGPNELEGAATNPAGFLHGLWHGFIALFTFIGSLFTDSINIYEVHNNGGWYNFGFMLGIGAFSGGAAKGSK